MQRALVAALLAAGCGGGTAVSQTSSGVSDPEYAPPAAGDGTSHVASASAIPAPTDPSERLVYTKAGSVWAMTADGSQQDQISVRASSAPDVTPALGPGGVIAYSSARDGAAKIYVAELEEGAIRAVTDGADGGDREPAWSPDGTRLVFVRGGPGEQRHLFVVDVAGGAPALLLAGDDNQPDRVGAPAWSPDGERIVFAADRRAGQGTLLWTVRADGSELRPLTQPQHGAWFAHDARPAWSPDGAKVVFASNRHVASADHAADFDVYSVGAAGGELTRLTDDPGVADDPTFSPDGKRIFFTSTRDANNAYEVEIYVMPASGGDQRRMTRDERPQNGSPSAGRTK